VVTPTEFYSLGGAFVPSINNSTGNPLLADEPPTAVMQGPVSHNSSNNIWSNSSSDGFSHAGYTVFGEAGYGRPVRLKVEGLLQSRWWRKFMVPMLM